MGKKNTGMLVDKTSVLTKKKKSLSDPDIDTMFDASGLPGVPIIRGDTPEVIAQKETDEIMNLIKENRRNYAERFRDIESGEFWFCVCFQSRSQKEKFIEMFLEKYAPSMSIDEFGDKYVSGLEIAEILEIQLPIIALEVKKNRLAPKSLRKMEVIS